MLVSFTLMAVDVFAQTATAGSTQSDIGMMFTSLLWIVAGSPLLWWCFATY